MFSMKITMHVLRLRRNANLVDNQVDQRLELKKRTPKSKVLPEGTFMRSTLGALPLQWQKWLLWQGLYRVMPSSRLASSFRRKSPTHHPAPSHLDIIFLAASSSAASHNKSKTINFVSSYAHVCSRMLTYAHVCSRMITCAHACSSMLSQTRRKPKPFPSRTNLNISNLTSSIVW
jgi:hypothetical protein